MRLVCRSLGSRVLPLQGRVGLRVRLLLAGLLLSAGVAGTARAQPLLYAQRLPEGTVYLRLANALPGSVTVGTDFAGKVALGDAEAARISPYFVSVTAGSKTVPLLVEQGGGKTATVTIEPKSGSFITVVLHEKAGGVTAAIVTDKPDYNQLRARLTFYNATDGCPNGALAESGRTIFSGVPPDGVKAGSVSPVAATVVASCGTEKAHPLDMGKLEAGGQYSVWMLRLGGQIVSFTARDTIAPPR